MNRTYARLRRKLRIFFFSIYFTFLSRLLRHSMITRLQSYASGEVRNKIEFYHKFGLKKWFKRYIIQIGIEKGAKDERVRAHLFPDNLETVNFAQWRIWPVACVEQRGDLSTFCDRCAAGVNEPLLIRFTSITDTHSRGPFGYFFFFYKKNPLNEQCFRYLSTYLKRTH